ncbi:ATP-binding protein [Streptomyces sp. URMC 127]|uniref:ATP-binding protein n=1 Tax=Streptomyces sp. URMC 127 TaxID=3423402 RepID=UPI003F1B7D35
MRRVLTTVVLAVAALSAGAAGTAGTAAPGAVAYAAAPPPGLDLQGFNALNPGSLTTAVDGTAEAATTVIGDAGGKVIGTAVPAVGSLGETLGKAAVKPAQKPVKRAAEDGPAGKELAPG